MGWFPRELWKMMGAANDNGEDQPLYEVEVVNGVRRKVISRTAIRQASAKASKVGAADIARIREAMLAASPSNKAAGKV